MYNLGQYFPSDSPIHRLDPRIKILSVVALSIMILKARGFEPALISLFLTAAAFKARIKPRHVIDALRPLAFFLCVLFLLHLFFTPGRPLLELPPGITITLEGLNRGLLVAWQFAALVAGASILTLTTSSSGLVSGLERLLRPFNRLGVPSHDIAVMISLALRFVPTLLEESERVRKAQAARGADFKKGNIIKRLKTMSFLVIPLALGSLRRAEELARAMEGRCYERGPRTYLRELRLAPPDYAASAVVIVFLAGLKML
jgi:energy-coupling factor transporter transmembrane protein EcfT